MAPLWKKKTPSSSLIVPVIKSSVSETEPSSQPDITSSEMLISEPFIGNLMVMYAFDLPEFFQFVNAKDCEKLKLNPSEMRELSIKNLKARLPGIQRHKEVEVFMLTAGGNMESSLLLTDDLWEDQEKLVSGDLVASIPARDVLLFTGSESVEGIQAIKDSIERVWNGGNHLLTKEFLIRIKGKWQIFHNAS